MFQPRTVNVVFSFEQPEAVLDTLLPILRQSRTLPDYKKSQAAIYTSPRILLIDTVGERIGYFVYLLQANGYSTHVVGTIVDAFTLFLRNAFVPFAILLGEEQASERFFLMRLLQQVTQKYGWNPPCIYIRTYMGDAPQLSQPHTDALQPFAFVQESPVLSSEQSVPPLSPVSRTNALPAPSLRVAVPSLPAVSPSQSQLSASRAVPEYIPTPVSLVEASHPLSIADVPTLHKTPALPVSSQLLRTQMSPVLQVETRETRSERVSLVNLSIGRYHMQASLGDGPLGTVYRTYDRLREHDIALKAVQIDTIPSYMDTHDFTSDSNLFQQEIDLLRSLQHPHILAPLSCGKSYISGSPFVYKTMCYCAAGSLAAWLYRMGNVRVLSPAEVANVVRQLANALHLVHQHRVTYQNFKLSNLLIQEPVDEARHIHILLTDFALVQNGTFLLKTPSVFPYMAPERWQGQSLPASDQYGLAAIAYELLTGRLLFSGQSEHVVKQLHMTMPPQPPSTLSPQVSTDVDKVLLRALAKRPEERFPSIVAFAEALQKASV